MRNGLAKKLGAHPRALQVAAGDEARSPAATDVPLRHLRRCSCAHGPILHGGAKGDGPCMLPRCRCVAYSEADHD